MQTKIDNQKSIADLVLSKLELLDRNCIIAGGAPRDWYLGNLATDIDVYLHYPIYTTVRQRVGLLNELGLTVKSKHEAWRVNEIYKTNHHIKQLYNCELLGEKIQVMFVDQPTFTSVVDTFPISISKVWYKKGIIGTTQEFRDSVKYKILWKTIDSYKEDNKYIAKIKDKFSDYRYMTEEQSKYYLQDYSRKTQIQTKLSEIVNEFVFYSGNISKSELNLLKGKMRDYLDELLGSYI